MPPVDDASERDAATPVTGPDKPPTDSDRAPEPPSPWAAPSSPSVSSPQPAPSPWGPPGPQPAPTPYQVPPQYQGPGQAPGQMPGQAAGQGPWPMPYPGPYGWPAPAGPPQEYNGFAITSAVLGILGCFCCLWVAAIGFGIAALRQIPVRNQKGRGLAITGLVMSGVWLVVSILVGITLAVTGQRSSHSFPDFPGDSPTTGSTSVFGLRTGDCFDRTTSETASKVVSVDLTPCDEPHDGEVFGPVTLPSGPYPGKSAVTKAADAGCSKLVDSYVMDTWSLPDSVVVHYFYPDSVSWKATGENHATCILVSKTHEKLTAPLRRDSTDLTMDQETYLRVVNVLNDVAANGPDGRLEDDPDAYRAWAGKVSGAITYEIGEFEARHWSAGSAQPVAALVAELKVALPHWQAAQKSRDTGTLSRELSQAGRHSGHDQAKAARAALGLSTTDQHDGSGSDGSDGSGSDVAPDSSSSPQSV